MKIERINYGKSFELQGYWEKMGIDIQLDDGDTPEKAFNVAKGIVDKLHKEYHSDLYEQTKVINKEKPKSTPEEDASWKQLIKTLTKLGNKEDALKFLGENKEWKLNLEAKTICNSLPSKK